MPKVPRNFKIPFGLLVPVLGIIGDIVMIYGIDHSWKIRLQVYGICMVTFVVLGIYAAIWVKRVMGKKLFEAVPLREVMAMESDLYYVFHRRGKKKNIKR